MLPEKILKELTKDIEGQNILTFALRHRVSTLTLHGHYIVDPNCGVDSYIEKESTEAFKEIFHNLINNNIIPIFGFNPTGITISLRNRHKCRAFDSYDLPICNQPGNILCKSHQLESWWDNNTPVKLTQSKMYQYYLKLENCMFYSKKELERLLDNFWERYQSWSSKLADIDLSEALEQFGFADLNQLREVSKKDLQKKFYQISLHKHPDRGGYAEDFLKLKSSYQLLKEIY